MPGANVFFQAVSAEADVSQADVKKVLTAIKNSVVQNVKKDGTCRIPTIAAIKVKKRPAREACTRKVFGKRCELEAWPERSCVKMSAVKQLSDEILR